MKKMKPGISLINPIVIGGKGHYFFITGGQEFKNSSKQNLNS